MIRELHEEDVSDMALYLRNGIRENNIYTSSFTNKENYILKNLRHSFFSFEIYAVGEYINDDLCGIVLMDQPQNEKCSFMNISVCSIENSQLLKEAVRSAFESNQNITKIKILVTSQQLIAGFCKMLEDCHFDNELCLRKYHNSSKNVFIYSCYRKWMKVDENERSY